MKKYQLFLAVLLLLQTIACGNKKTEAPASEAPEWVGTIDVDNVSLSEQRALFVSARNSEANVKNLPFGFKTGMTLNEFLQHMVTLHQHGIAYKVDAENEEVEDTTVIPGKTFTANDFAVRDTIESYTHYMRLSPFFENDKLFSLSYKVRKTKANESGNQDLDIFSLFFFKMYTDGNYRLTRTDLGNGNRAYIAFNGNMVVNYVYDPNDSYYIMQFQDLPLVSEEDFQQVLKMFD